MTSSYTSNLGIEKPATGDQSGTWGDTVNVNMDIVDRAINGVGAISLSGTSHTLTTTDGTLSDGMYKVLVLGGSPSGTNTITIDPNDQEKVYFVYNNSGQDAVFSQGSGGNVTVANGDSKLIYADGAGAGAAVSDFSANLAMSSVNIDGGTIDGTTIGGSSAGAGTFSSLTATTADINGGTIDNSTIGATTAAAGNFTNIDFTGNLTQNGSAFTSGGGLFKGDNGTTGDASTGPGDIFRINEQELNTDVTITSTENASATGPLSVASGTTLTVDGNLSII